MVSRFRPKLFDVLGLVAILVMGYTLTVLVLRHTTGHGELSLELNQKDLEEGFREGYEYHGIYMGSRKVGAQRIDRYKLEEGFQMKTELELSFYGMRSIGRLDAVLDREFRLSSFELVTTGGQLEGTMKGVWTGSALVVDADLTSLLTGPMDFSRSFELPEAPFFPASLWPMVMRKALDEGARTSIPYYDPESMQPVTVDIIYRGRKNIEIMGQEIEAYHFEEIKLEKSHDIYVSAIGEVLMEELPFSMLAVREPEAEARFGLRGDATATSDPTPRAAPLTLAETRTPRPEAWQTQVRFTLERRPVLRGHFGDAVQRIDADSSAVLVTSPTNLTETSPLKPSQRLRLANSLSASLGVDVNDPDLDLILSDFHQLRARPDRLAHALTHHVASNVAFEPTTDQSSGNAALVAGRGNALAQARGLVALLRAAGIPARLAHGALAVPVSEGVRLVRHSWVEVYLSEGWVALDPTLDQAPADSGRLVLVRGELEKPELLDEHLTELQVLRVEAP